MQTSCLRGCIIEHMSFRLQRRFASPSGVTMIEYAIGLALLILALVGALNFLQEAAEERAEESQGTVKTMVPCDGELSGEQCL